MLLFKCALNASDLYFKRHLTLKNKQTWVYSEIAENCNSGHKSYGKITGKFREQRRGVFLHKGKRKLELL